MAAIAAPVADVDGLRARLRAITEAELTAFGRKMHALCYPLTYDGDGKRSVPAFSIQLGDARGMEETQPVQDAPSLQFHLSPE